MMFAINPSTVYAQAQASADIQLAADGVASTTTEVNGTSGGTVVIEVLASGYDGALGVNTSFTLSDASAVTNIEGTHQLGFNFPPNTIQGWSAGSTTFSFQSGGLSAATETGDGLKVVGVITLTLADPFVPFEITFDQIVISTPTPATLTPGTVLKVT